jgi:hypothetical protein
MQTVIFYLMVTFSFMFSSHSARKSRKTIPAPTPKEKAFPRPGAPVTQTGGRVQDAAATATDGRGIIGKSPPNRHELDE